MHQRVTNICAITHDVYRFTFEPAGALEVTNEYSGLAVASAHLYRFRRSLACMPHVLNLAQWRIIVTKYEPPPFAAYVGIDWADKKHDLCIQIPAEGTQEFEVIPHRANSIDEWLRSLYERVNGPIAIAIELTKGPVVSALQKYDFVVIYPVNPSSLAKYRQAFAPSRAKDDPTDAALAVDMLLRHPERFKPLRPQGTDIRTLVTLVEQRRQLVSERIRITNRLRAALKQYYPNALEWFGHVDTILFCDFIEKWPTLKQVKRARSSTLKRFFSEHNVRSTHLVEGRVTAIKEAVPLTEDTAIVVPFRMKALAMIGQLRLLLESIKAFDTEIDIVAMRHPDYELFRALPGAGPLLAPRLLTAFGEQRDRFASAAEIQMCSGVAPVTERSGKKHWVHWRMQCPRFLRQTFVEWAAQTINKSYWAGEFYNQQRAKGCTYQAAVRALAFKWIRIVYRCWQTRTHYDEAKYLKVLERRGSPLMAKGTA
jgi:transposase